MKARIGVSVADENRLLLLDHGQQHQFVREPQSCGETRLDVAVLVSGSSGTAATRPRKRMANLGVEACPMTPEQFAEFVRVESGRWADIIRRFGAKVE